MKSRNPFVVIFKILLKLHLIMAGINLVFAYREERAEKADIENGHIYRWKHGNIYYHKRGIGSPVLLVHGLEPGNSGRDLETLSKALSTKHTVYTIDLLGFGFSDKPWITYTNYIYVLLIQDFIKDVIKIHTDIIGFEESALTVLQAHKDNDEKIGKVLVINPAREEKYKVPKLVSLRLKKIIDFPLYGTFIYNMYSLTRTKPLNRDSRHVFASRLTGHLSTDITGHENLIGESVKVIETKDAAITYGDINAALI